MNKKIKRVLKRVLPLKLIYGVLGRYGMLKLRFTDREAYDHKRFLSKHNESFGFENANLNFYVIRKDNKNMGLLSCYLTALGHLKELEDVLKNESNVPIMDLQSLFYKGIHDETDAAKKVNAWEHYFCNFSSFKMDDVYKSKNVFFQSGYTLTSAMCFFNNDPINEETIKPWLETHNKYFRLRDDLLGEFENERKLLFGNKRVLGCMLREGYMLLAQARDSNGGSIKPAVDIRNHPVQPDINDYIDKTRGKLGEFDCDYLFVSCETSYVLDLFKKAFGNKVLYVDRVRTRTDNFTYSEYRLNRISSSQKESVRTRTVAYLKEVYLLSRCTSLFAGKCSGTVVAALWNDNQYEHLEIINQGLY